MLSEDELRDAVLLIFANKQVTLKIYDTAILSLIWNIILYHINLIHFPELKVKLKLVSLSLARQFSI